MKAIALNKRARFDYDITDTMVAGLVLTGPETKSAKAGHLSLKGSFVSVTDGEAYIVNAHINPYPNAGPHIEQNPTRSRKLLLHAKELDQIIAARQSGLGVVALAAGIQRGYVKLEIGIGRGKKRYDKRATIKSRETTRELGRELKNKK